VSASQSWPSARAVWRAVDRLADLEHAAEVGLASWRQARFDAVDAVDAVLADVPRELHREVLRDLDEWAEHELARRCGRRRRR
jgi:hypothetical protein